MAVLARRELFLPPVDQVQPVVRFTHCQLSSSVTVIAERPAADKSLFA